MLKESARTVRARNKDVERYAQLARKGEIPEDAVGPLATVFAAGRKAQITLGPGYKPLHAILDTFPKAYVDQCLGERLKAA